MKLQIIIASMFAACSMHAADPSIAALQAEYQFSFAPGSGFGARDSFERRPGTITHSG
jgi:hypothetical protein